MIGNPPWLAFRHMSADLQKRFRDLAKDERVYVGGRFATQNDLCALFAIRSAHLYLRSGGRLALIFPLAAMTRGQFEHLQKGSFRSVKIAWDEAWTMDDTAQPLFPVPSCAVFGRKRARSRPFPDKVRVYSGLLPMRDASEDLADAKLTIAENTPAPRQGRFDGGSAYREAFRQGATLVPRMLCLVGRRRMGRLGVNPSAPLVASRRSNQEKLPWKALQGIENPVEAEFLRPVLLGESILPYRLLRPLEGVIPVSDNGHLFDGKSAANRGFGGLNAWMRKAEAVWTQHSDSGGMTLTGRWNYHNELGAQFPIPRRASSMLLQELCRLLACCLTSEPLSSTNSIGQPQRTSRRRAISRQS